MPIFKRLLIANRGEIAARIARTAHKMGLEPIIVYSDADIDTLAVREAKESIRLGPGRAADSYLNSAKILAAAKAVQADAIHPGYGFLSENSTFAREVLEAGMIWVGPSPNAMDMVSSKSKAKDLAEKSNVPTVPGFRGAQDLKSFVTNASKIGYPVLLKAAAGGGGRGIRLVTNESELKTQFDLAKSEALAGFGNDELLIEKYIEKSRHIEVQIFGDEKGTVVHLGERDCSAQRRHQKLVEESPSPALDAKLRDAITSAAVRLSKACGYTNAGTVEFLLTPTNDFYFLEVNARLQVEHPVTELVTGQDLVEWQLRIAQGESVPLTQDKIRFQGHAIQTRLYAEDPYENYRPQTGAVQGFTFPKDQRTDHFLTYATEISPFYDSMLAKLISFGPNREQARQMALKALDETLISGLKTNQLFLKQILQSDFFTKGQTFTQTLDQTTFEKPAPTDPRISQYAATLAAYLNSARGKRLPAWTNSSQHHARFAWRDGQLLKTITVRETPSGFEVDGKTATKAQWNAPTLTAVIDGAEIKALVHIFNATTDVGIHGQTQTFTNALNVMSGTAKDSDPNAVMAPMAGTVTKILTEPSHKVNSGDVLAIIEAMKMQLELRSPRDGVIDSIAILPGAQVKTRQVLLRLTPKE